MKNLNIGILVCLIAIGFTSCKKGGLFCFQENGNTISENRDLTGFDKIDLAIAADLNISQGSDYSVTITGSDNLLEILETKVKGSTLKIDFRKNKCVRKDYTIIFDIVLPNLKGLSISGSGDIFIPNKIETDELSINISGSGNLEMDSLKVNHLDADISGSGSMNLVGIATAESEKFNISGSGKLHTFGFPTKVSDINISGSGTCEVFVTEELKVNISGSGKIIYKGHPTIDQNVSGSGSIRPY